MKKKTYLSAKAPAAIGPYSHASSVGELIFVSGQLPVNAQGELENRDIAEATRCCLRNIAAILEEAQSSLANCLKCTIFLTDLNDFALVNAAYGEFFSEAYPARACVEVSALPKGARVEIEAIAHL